MATGIRSNGFTEYPRNPAASVGKKLITTFYEKTIATGAGVNTLHILAGPLSYDDRIAAVIGATPAMTSATTNDLGFWKRNEDGTFTVLGSGNELWSNADLSSALSYRELLGTVNTSLDRDDSIATLLSKTSDAMPAGGVYVGLLIKIASTAASVNLALEIVIDKANTQ